MATCLYSTVQYVHNYPETILVRSVKCKSLAPHAPMHCVSALVSILNHARCYSWSFILCSKLPWSIILYVYVRSHLEYYDLRNEQTIRLTVIVRSKSRHNPKYWNEFITLLQDNFYHRSLIHLFTIHQIDSLIDCGKFLLARASVTLIYSIDQIWKAPVKIWSTSFLE